MAVTRQLLLQKQQEEELLTENPERWVMFPIKYHSLWHLYKKAENSFWAYENFRFINDLSDYKSLDTQIIESILSIIQYNVELDSKQYLRPSIFTCQLIDQVQIPEARAFYGFQIMYENVHFETFASLSNLLEFCKVPRLYANDKHLWRSSKLEKTNSFFEKIFSNLIVKTLFSTGLVLLREFLKKKKICKESVSALDNILNDIEIQSQFATTLLNMFKYKLDQPLVYEALNDAINIEMDYLKNTLDFNKFGLDPDDVSNFLKVSADEILNSSGYEPFYNIKNYNFINALNMGPILKVEAPKKINYGQQKVVLDEDF